MVRLLLILALVAVVFWVYSIVDCAMQPSTRHRGVSKGAWVLIVVLLPVVGGILWFTAGRIGKRAIAARRAPDDDPEFLRTIGSISDQDERIRRLEEELAQLDAEAAPDSIPDVPGETPSGRATPQQPDDEDDSR